MKENKILKVLKEVFYGTKLYSTAIGEVKFNGILTLPDNSKRIKLTLENHVEASYFPDGRYRKEGEITLYPSKRMRDWGKFAWKKGDVLVNSCGTYCIFEEFSGYPYTTFLAKFTNYGDIISNSTMVKATKEWNKVSSETAEKYIESINIGLKKENRRLNLETLEVEELQLKFKDGDIVATDAVPSMCYSKCIFILKGDLYTGEYHAKSCAFYNVNNNKLYLDIISTSTEPNIRFATKEEKQQFFEALAKEGKRWNAEKKVIEDTKPKPKKENATYKKVSDKPEHEFQPFEKVLVRDVGVGKWAVDLYGIKNEGDPYPYRCVGGCYAFCIPYEGNEHLLGTTNSQEE